MLSAFVQLSFSDSSTQPITGEDYARRILALTLTEQVPLRSEGFLR